MNVCVRACVTSAFDAIKGTCCSSSHSCLTPNGRGLRSILMCEREREEALVIESSLSPFTLSIPSLSLSPLFLPFLSFFFFTSNLCFPLSICLFQSPLLSLFTLFLPFQPFLLSVLALSLSLSLSLSFCSLPVNEAVKAQSGVRSWHDRSIGRSSPDSSVSESHISKHATTGNVPTHSVLIHTNTHTHTHSHTHTYTHT